MKGIPVVLAAFVALWPTAQGFAPVSVRSSGVVTAQRSQDRRLFMAESTISENQTPESKDNAINTMFAHAINEVKTMDMNSAINNGIVLAISIAVLLKLSLVDSGMTRGWTAAEMAVRIPMDNWADYYQVLTESPIQTKAATSATVYTIGDIIAQRTEGVSMGELDRGRIVRSLLAGAIGHGPLSHYWYDLSEGFFNDYLHWTAWWSFFPKVILDQATWAPFWNNSYIVLLGLMKRDSWGTMWSDIKRTTVPLIVSGLKLWPLAHCVTYGLVPLENRLLWVDVVEILWVTILASQAAGSVAGDDAPPVEEEATSAVTQ